MPGAKSGGVWYSAGTFADPLKYGKPRSCADTMFASATVSSIHGFIVIQAWLPKINRGMRATRELFEVQPDSIYRYLAELPLNLPTYDNFQDTERLSLVVDNNEPR